MSKEIMQFREMVAEEYHRIEELKAAAKERGEVILNIWNYDGLTDDEKRKLIDDIQNHEAEQ